MRCEPWHVSVSNETANWQRGRAAKVGVSAWLPRTMFARNSPLASLEDDGTHARPYPTARVQKKQSQRCCSQFCRAQSKRLKLRQNGFALRLKQRASRSDHFHNAVAKPSALAQRTAHALHSKPSSVRQQTTERRRRHNQIGTTEPSNAEEFCSGISLAEPLPTQSRATARERRDITQFTQA